MSEEIKEDVKQEEGQEKATPPAFDDNQTAYIKKMMDDFKKESESETDRRVSKFVNENKELRSTVDEMRKSQLTKEEQIAYELEQKEIKMQEMENNFNSNKLQFEKLQFLNEKGLPQGYLDVVKGDNIEDFTKGMDAILNINKTHIDTTIKQKLSTTAKPTEGESVNQAVFTRNQVKAMSPAEEAANHDAILESMKSWN